MFIVFMVLPIVESRSGFGWFLWDTFRFAHCETPARIGIRTIIYLFIDKFFNNKSVDEIIEANKEKAAKKAEKRGEQNAKLEEYAAMKTKNIDRRSISQIANTNKGDTDSKTAVKSSSGSSSSKGSKKVDKNSAEADKKSISGYAHMLNRHDD